MNKERSYGPATLELVGVVTWHAAGLREVYEVLMGDELIPQRWDGLAREVSGRWVYGKASGYLLAAGDL